MTRNPRNQWPASRQFVRGVPQEETRPTLYTANLVTNTSVLPAILNLHSLISEVMQYTNHLPKFLAIVAGFLAATKSQNRAAVTKEHTVYYLNLAEHLAYIVATADIEWADGIPGED